MDPRLRGGNSKAWRIAAFLLAALFAGPTRAQTLSVEGGIDGYLAGTTPALLKDDALCRRAREAVAVLGREHVLRLETAGPAAKVSGAEGLEGPAGALAQDAVELVTLVKRLAGGGAGRSYLLRLGPSGLFVAADGQGGRPFTDACEAMGFLLAQLLADAGVDMGNAAAAGGPAAVLASLSRGGAGEVPLVTLAQGGQVTVRIKGLSLAGGEVPLLAGPPGLTVHGLRREANGDLVATLSAGPGLPVGEVFLLAYAPGSRLSAVATWSLTVLPGEAAAPLPPAAPRPIQAGQSATGTLDAGRTVARHELLVDRAGTLSVRSLGGTDVRAVLRGPDGRVVAADDDGAGGYRFRLEAAVRPGAYALEVSHCCGGAGEYTVETRLDGGGR